MANPKRQDVIGIIEKLQSDRVKVAVSDIDGILRGKYLHKDKFLSALKDGFGFCSVIFGWDINDRCYDKGTVSGWHNGYPDILAKIDLATYRTVPWENNLPFFLADFQNQGGEALPVCPRQLLKKVIQEAEIAGFRAKFGLEFEWFNFAESPQSLATKNFCNPTTITPGAFGYSLLRPALNREFFTALMDQLPRFGVPVEGFHTETGPGVLEVALVASDALEAADRGLLFKTAVKEIAAPFNIMPSFMAKWHPQLPGCGGHMHQSLWDSQDQHNLFSTDQAPHKMSKLFEHYLAGQMAIMPEIMPFLVPNINSYKRLVEGCWAPTKMSWGVDNRTTALRVISGSDKSTRLETRLGGSDINPYLAVAAALGCGLYGIKHSLSLETVTEGNAYTASSGIRLSRTLAEACDKLSQSKAANEIFGEEFVKHFLLTREWECQAFNTAVTNYEIERYFEIV